MCPPIVPEYIWEEKTKADAYLIFKTRLRRLEESTIISEENTQKSASDNSMDIANKLFPILESISLSIADKTNSREYLKELGYDGFEADLIQSMFRNGLSHSLNPYHFVYKNGEVTWALGSSSGSGGFVPHHPGYIDPKDGSVISEADKPFTFNKLAAGEYHASLLLDGFVSQLLYDLEQREASDTRTKIKILVGQKKDQDIPVKHV